MKKRSKAVTRIKRVIILLIVLAVLGAAFYFGYYQFQLPADTYGVIFTKLNGWNPAVVKPAEFRLEWEGLIPLNLRIEKFALNPVETTIEAKGQLPSSEEYSLLLENNPDFSYSYKFKVSYIFNPESLPQLVSEEFLRSETFDEWIIIFNETLTSDAASLLQKAASDPAYLEKISYNYTLLGNDFMDSLADKYPGISLISFSPVEINFPDLALYAEGRRQYFVMEKTHNDLESAAIEKTTSRIAEESAKLELLEKYGALFSKYPALIDYYRIFPEDGSELIPSIELPVLDEGN